MSPLEVTKLLTPMKRNGEVLSIKSLNEQINTMTQAIYLIEDEDSRLQFEKRIEVVQRDFHRLRSELESKMPKRPSTLNIDHSRLLIGSPEEGYMPLTQTIWQNVQGMTQRIDRLSEGLALVVQRHRDKGRHLKPFRSDKDRHSHSDYPGVSDPYVRDKIQQKNYYLGTIDESSDSGSVYSFASSQSTLIGNQAQTPPGHAGRYYHPSSNAQPSYPSPQIVNMSHYGRFSTNSSPSSPIISDASGRNRSHGYFPEHPSSESLSYFPGGLPNPSQPGTPIYQTPITPGTNPSLWRIPAEIPNVGNFNNASFVNYVGQKPGLHLEYPQNFQKPSSRHTHRNRK